MSTRPNFRDALRMTMAQHRIKNGDLAQASSVKPALLSGYKTGNNGLHADTLEQIFLALPLEAQDTFLLLLRPSIPPQNPE